MYLFLIGIYIHINVFTLSPNTNAPLNKNQHNFVKWYVPSMIKKKSIPLGKHCNSF